MLCNFEWICATLRDFGQICATLCNFGQICADLHNLSVDLCDFTRFWTNLHVPLCAILNGSVQNFYEYIVWKVLLPGSHFFGRTFLCKFSMNILFGRVCCWGVTLSDVALH